MKATEDFLDVVLTAHILAAARELQSGSTTLPSCKDLAKQIVSRFVTISIPSTNTDSDDSTAAAQNSSNDSVFAYAVDVLSMCLIWHAFRDAVREGDGDRIIRYWKLLAVIFRQEKHYNYSNEAVNLVMQTLLLSPRQVSELKWSRTVIVVETAVNTSINRTCKPASIPAGSVILLPSILFIIANILAQFWRDRQNITVFGVSARFDISSLVI